MADSNGAASGVPGGACDKRRPAAAALWVAVQILPFGIFAHPIWRSTSAALHEPMLGSISVDPAASIISLGDYMLLAAVAFLSSAVAVDRQRAEWVLFALSIATTIAGLIVIGHQFDQLIAVHKDNLR